MYQFGFCKEEGQTNLLQIDNSSMDSQTNNFFGHNQGIFLEVQVINSKPTLDFGLTKSVPFG